MEATTETDTTARTYALPARQTMQAIRALSHCVSTDTSRALLTAIRVELSVTGIVLVATDSYRLGKVELRGCCVPGDVLLPLSLVKSLCKSFTRSTVAKWNDSETLSLSWSGETPETAVVTVSAAGVTLTDRPEIGTYPDYRQLMPETQFGRAQFNASYLATVGKIADEVGAQFVVCDSIDHSKPAQFTITTADDDTVTYLLMPVRITQ